MNQNAIGSTQVLVYERDFAKSNLAATTELLGTIPANFVVVSMTLKSVGTVTPGNTLIIGEDGGGDADGYFTDIIAGVGDGVFQRGKGALLWDATAGDTNYLERVVPAAKDGILMTNATTARVAGKLILYVFGYQAH